MFRFTEEEAELLARAMRSAYCRHLVVEGYHWDIACPLEQFGGCPKCADLSSYDYLVAPEQEPYLRLARERLRG